MSVETRQLQLSGTSGASDPGPFTAPGAKEFRVICDQCGVSSPWQTSHPGTLGGSPPAWFIVTTGTDQAGLERPVHLCGHCAGGGGTSLPLPKVGSIWWSYTQARSVAKVVTVDPLGSVSITILYMPKGNAPGDKRLQPLNGAILLPIREFNAAWGRPKPDPADLSSRAIWINFATWETVTLDGAEYHGGSNYIVSVKGHLTRFDEFVKTHVPTGARQPRSRYERLLEDDF